MRESPTPKSRMIAHEGVVMRTSQPHPHNTTFTPALAIVGHTGEGAFLYTIKIEGVLCSALIDTGSSITIWRDWVAATPVHQRTVSGERVPIDGRGWLKLEHGVSSYCHEIWIAAVQDPCILGLDFLQGVGMLLDLQHGNIGWPAGPL